MHERRDGALSRSWFVRYTSPTTGKRREPGIGRWPEISLSDARDAALTLRTQARNGIDPIEAREELRKQAAIEAVASKTFEEVAHIYIATHSPSWKNAKHRQQWVNTIRDYVLPIFGATPIGEIDTNLVLAVLQADDLWNSKQETSRRIRSRIELVLQFAITRGWRAGPNPATWRGHLENILPTRREPVRHHAAMAHARSDKRSRAALFDLNRDTHRRNTWRDVARV